VTPERVLSEYNEDLVWFFFIWKNGFKNSYTTYSFVGELPNLKKYTTQSSLLFQCKLKIFLCNNYLTAVFFIPAIFAKCTAWNGSQQMTKHDTNVAHMIVTRRRSLSDREDVFLLRNLAWLTVLLVFVKLTELLVLNVLIRVSASRRTIKL